MRNFWGKQRYRESYLVKQYLLSSIFGSVPCLYNFLFGISSNQSSMLKYSNYTMPRSHSFTFTILRNSSLYNLKKYLTPQSSHERNTQLVFWKSYFFRKTSAKIQSSLNIALTNQPREISLKIIYRNSFWKQLLGLYFQINDLLFKIIFSINYL